VKSLGSCLAELVEWPYLRHGEQSPGRVGRAGAVLALRRDQRAAGSPPGFGRELSGTLLKGGQCRQSAAGLRSSGRPLELGGDVLIKPRDRGGTMPGAAIGIALGIGDLRKRPVDALALLL
jgi:hypothetical protein